LNQRISHPENSSLNFPRNSQSHLDNHFVGCQGTPDFAVFSPPDEKWRKVVNRGWWKRQLSIFLKVIISNSCFAHLSIHNSAVSQSRKQLKSTQNLTIFNWKRCCKNSELLLMNLTDMLPSVRAKNGPQNERTPNLGASKDTNMRNRRYRGQMW
jgi:hypothetical protein